MHRMVAQITPAGSTGSATGSATASPIYHGELHALYIDYASGITSATVVQIKQAHAPNASYITLTGNTDGWYFPRHEHGETGVGAPLASTAGLSTYPVTEHLTARVGSSSPTTNAVTAYIYIKC